MMGKINHWQCDFVVMGDFNEVHFASERHGSTFYASNAAKFNMRESHMDYGPTPFRLFHSWFLEQDFTFVAEDSWKNVMSIQTKSIREHGRRVLQDYLLEIDLHLDKRGGLMCVSLGGMKEKRKVRRMEQEERELEKRR
ncbi:hypothetical protein Tco_0322893 [Tanacetum coccineum]